MSCENIALMVIPREERVAASACVVFFGMDEGISEVPVLVVGAD